MYVGAVEKMQCVCGCYKQRGHNGDGCDLTSTSCNYDLRRVFIFPELGKVAMT